ncbi:MAG: hypothetical protein F7B20_04345 [Aeropyrum sp.]|nr:hypothetical protein [Aeropyrum sp.]
MGLNVNGVGIIAIACSRCKAKLYWYVIGDGANRNKFSGPPVPSKALAGYDNSQCPICGSQLSVAKPREVRIMTRKEFEETYIVTDYKLVRRRTLVEEQLKISHTVGLTLHGEAASQAEGF